MMRMSQLRRPEVVAGGGDQKTIVENELQLVSYVKNNKSGLGKFCGRKRKIKGTLGQLLNSEAETVKENEIFNSPPQKNTELLTVLTNTRMAKTVG